jgi:hypothetical protein
MHKLVFTFFFLFLVLNQASAQEMCGVCVNFMDNAIDQLLNIIVNVGVLGTCGALCNLLDNQVEAVICNLLCDYVGIEAFITLIDDIDPDPIWICEEISICPINDHASGKITGLHVTPQVGKVGDVFTVVIEFAITNVTGTGEVGFDCLAPVGFPFGDGALLVSTQVGNYAAKFQFEADPNQEQPFEPGTYKVDAALCEGACGSSHSHSFYMDKAQTTFQIQHR